MLKPVEFNDFFIFSINSRGITFIFPPGRGPGARLERNGRALGARRGGAAGANSARAMRASDVVFHSNAIGLTHSLPVPSGTCTGWRAPSCGPAPGACRERTGHAPGPLWRAPGARRERAGRATGARRAGRGRAPVTCFFDF